MLSAEQKYFIQIINDYLNFTATESVSGIDWNKLIAIFKMHKLIGILNNQCSKYITGEANAAVFDYDASELVVYNNREMNYKKIKNEFEKENIRFVSVKGLNVAKYYPVPHNRTMGDCDIIVHNFDLKKADNIMKRLGFEYRQTPDFENFYQKGKIYVEIHDHLLYDEVANTKNDINFCDEVWSVSKSKDDSTELAVDDSFHFVFLLLHLKKHLIHKGAGFRQFIDLYVVAKNAKLDWKYINEKLEMLGLTKFAGVCVSLIVKWFDADSSVFGCPLVDIDDEFFYIVTEKIFSGGVFGSDDENNSENARMQYDINSEKFTLLQKSAAKVRVVFPAYNVLRFSPDYGFVDKKPWLLPVVWIYRILRIIFVKSERKDTGIHGFQNNELLKRKDYLEKLGLL